MMSFFVPVDGTPVRKAMCCKDFDLRAPRFMIGSERPCSYRIHELPQSDEMNYGLDDQVEMEVSCRVKLEMKPMKRDGPTVSEDVHERLR